MQVKGLGIQRSGSRTHAVTHVGTPFGGKWLGVPLPKALGKHATRAEKRLLFGQRF